MSKNAIADQLDSVHPLITALSTDQELRSALLSGGFTEAMLDRGPTLYADARAARDAARAAHTAQLNATAALNEVTARVQANVTALSKLGRTLFRKDTAMLERLGLRLGQRATIATTTPQADPDDGSATETTPAPPRRTRSKSQAALVDRAYTLYNAIRDEQAVTQAFGEAGFTATRIAEERALVEQLESLDGAQELRKAEAENATIRQKAALDALRTWAAQVRAGAAANLRARPDLVRKLGV